MSGKNHLRHAAFKLLLPIEIFVKRFCAMGRFGCRRLLYIQHHRPFLHSDGRDEPFPLSEQSRTEAFTIDGSRSASAERRPSIPWNGAPRGMLLPRRAPKPRQRMRVSNFLARVKKTGVCFCAVSTRAGDKGPHSHPEVHLDKIVLDFLR